MHMQLNAVDKLEVVVLVDNYCDELLEDERIVKRLKLPSPMAPMGEPGFSLLVKVTKDNRSHTILMDTGISGHCLEHNIKVLASSQAVANGEITANVQDVEAVVLSHGHSDHFNGLSAFLKLYSGKMPVIVHPFAFIKRRFRHETGHCEPMRQLTAPGFETYGAVIDKRSEPSTIASDSILVSGQVQRTTDFEKGAPSLEAEIDNRWVKDPFYDDQSMAIHVRGKGLVILSGCSHAGIVNSIKHAQQVTGINKLHAVLGGFHLPGPDMSTSNATIAEIKKMAPDYVIPMHCTGWQTTTLFAAKMPEQFILNSVGSTYLFGCGDVQSG